MSEQYQYIYVFCVSSNYIIVGVVDSGVPRPTCSWAKATARLQRQGRNPSRDMYASRGEDPREDSLARRTTLSGFNGR